MQIKTPCCKLYLQQGAEKQIEQLSVSFIRTIPSAPESHRISGCINSRSRACGNAIYRRWGIAPRPEDPDSIEHSILPNILPVNTRKKRLSIPAEGKENRGPAKHNDRSAEDRFSYRLAP